MELWKKRVKEAVNQSWEKSLKQEAASMKSLKNLNLSVCGPGCTHPVWQTGTSSLQAIMAITRALMVVGRYPFTGHKVAGSRANDNCPYCMLNEPETTDHFILRCELYSDIRENMFKRMNKITNFNALSDEDKVKIIIDPSVLASDEDEAISRVMPDRRSSPCITEGLYTMEGDRCTNGLWRGLGKGPGSKVKL